MACTFLLHLTVINAEGLFIDIVTDPKKKTLIPHVIDCYSVLIYYFLMSSDLRHLKLPQASTD